MSKLQSIDSLMEQNPQAAYDSLCLYKKQMMEDSPRKVEMRYRLLTAKAQNKLYLEMPSDSVFRRSNGDGLVRNFLLLLSRGCLCV